MESATFDFSQDTAPIPRGSAEAALSKSAKKNRKRNEKRREAQRQKRGNSSTLPVRKHASRIVQKVKENQVVVIVAETGCGKSSQVPQILLESGLAGKGVIACTQPRRVAAWSLADRVASERRVLLGEEVGYHVRFDNSTSDNTVIKFMTDGILLRECLFGNEKRLSKYSIIILDEIHERSLQMDMLMSFMKEMLPKMPQLKVVIMSATMNSSAISQYFGKAPVLKISGSCFPVVVTYSPGYTIQHIEQTINEVLLQNKPGDILVFVPGVFEIHNLRNIFQKRKDVLLLAAHSKLPPWEMDKIFGPTPYGMKKVILSTNVSESSLTVDGLGYVIDTGYVNVKLYNGKTGVHCLETRLISKSEAEQRKGRVGRTAPGVCIRLYHEHQIMRHLVEEEEDKKKTKRTERPFRDYPQPQIEIDDLSHVALVLKMRGFDKPKDFPFLSSPNQQNMEAALLDLIRLGALDRSSRRLTSKGRKMAAFPLHPRFAAALLEAAEQGCEYGMLLLASMMSVFNGGRQMQLKKLARDHYDSQPDEASVMIQMLYDFMVREEESGRKFREFLQKYKIQRDWVYEAMYIYVQLMHQLDRVKRIVVPEFMEEITSAELRAMFRVQKALAVAFEPNLTRKVEKDEVIETKLSSGLSVNPMPELLSAPSNQDCGGLELFCIKDVRGLRDFTDIRFNTTFAFNAKWSQSKKVKSRTSVPSGLSLRSTVRNK